MARSHAKRWLEDHSQLALLFLVSVMIVSVMVVAEYGLRLVGYEYTRRPNNLVLENSFRVEERGLFVANPLADKHVGLGVNSKGFRSPEFFSDLASEREKLTVMILGDSFTWGASASPINESFPDVLRKAGYRVHNLGIPGIGPRQYQRMADEYLPRLKPDVVVVALYLGNDFLDGQWEPPPGRPPYYVLEGGAWIPTVDENGNYIESVEMAYEHFHNKFGRIRRFMRETAVGTLVIKLYRRAMSGTSMSNILTKAGEWFAINNAEAVQPPHAIDEEQLLRRYEITYDALRHIRALTREVGAQYFTLVIPALGPGCLWSADFSLDRQKTILDGFQPVYSDLSIDHYIAIPDCHLNNAGHLLIARRLERLLDTVVTERSVSHQLRRQT
jgi:lysophospholipase L1-like esterase